MTDSSDFWLGFLAGNIKAAIVEPAASAKARLKETLALFTDSPACRDELREALQAKPRPAEASLNDGYMLDRDYRPCGNPECRTPIPRSSRKRFCDAGCRHAAEEYASEQRDAAFRTRNPEYDSIPF